jgi:hypothetical protein
MCDGVCVSDSTLSFEVFSMSQGIDENFSIYQRLNSVFTAPVYESYTKTLNRRLKNFTSIDVRGLGTPQIASILALF